MLEEKVLSFEDFEIVSNGSFVSNIPNVESVCYRYEVPNGIVTQLDPNRLFLLKITGYKKYTLVNTTADFTLTAETDVAEVLNPVTGNVDYSKMAVAYGRSSGLVFRCSGYNPDTKELTFTGKPSDLASEDVDVFYLVGRGNIRFQITSPSQATKKSISVFNYSIASLNNANQFHKDEMIRIPTPYTLREGFRLEIAVNTPATVILKAQDIQDPNYSFNWNDVAIINVPVIIGSADVVAERVNPVEATNKQFNI